MPGVTLAVATVAVLMLLLQARQSTPVSVRGVLVDVPGTSLVSRVLLLGYAGWGMTKIDDYQEGMICRPLLIVGPTPPSQVMHLISWRSSRGKQSLSGER